MIIQMIITFIFEVFYAYILADLLVGVFHWFKDTYGTPFTPIIGRKIIWSSRLHHIRPRYVLEFSDWELFKTSSIWTLIWMGPVFYYIDISVFTITLFLVIGLNDVVHKYAHMSDIERPIFMSVLQKLKICQTHNEHHIHHTEPYIKNYCPITPFTNGILEKIDFWRRLEKIIEDSFGIKPRDVPDTYVEDPTYPAGIRFIR